MNPDTRAGVLLLCGMCLVPLLTGGFVGAWIQRKLLSGGAVNLLPGFVQRWIDEVKYGK